MAGGPKAVDVVMVTWNKRDLTRRAIESFRRHVRHPYRLICVDNGSTDGTLEDVREAADLLITASANLGAVRGRNLGWTATTADCVLFSEDASFDAVVARHSLEHSPMPLIDLLETARILRPGGLAVLAVPRLAGDAASALYAPLSDAQWRRLIDQAGLVLREVRGTPGDACVRYVAHRSAA